MNRRSERRGPLACLIAALLLVTVACTGAVGSAGPVPTGGSPAATEPPASSELTPNPESPAPTGEPSDEPSAEPTAEPTPSATFATQPDASPTPKPTPAPTATGATTVRAYFLLPDKDGGDPHLVPVLRGIPATRGVARAAVLELLAGPAATEKGMTTAVPAGTKLLGVTIADGVATVDLSGTFDNGGGTFSMLGRLAQLTYTLTQFPTVQTVRLRMDGQPVDVFGGEGIMLGDGLQRNDFLDYLPAMFVESPAWNGALPSGAHVKGLANVFEAQFLLRVRDASGTVLFETPVLASCGTGCWGTFDVTITYRVSKGQWGTLRVFDPSERDGSPTGIRDYRVWLTP